jgi:DNA-binding NarL/FixJ family response regulator
MARYAARSSRLPLPAIRVAAVDDHPIVVQGIATILSAAQPEDGSAPFEWIGQTRTFAELTGLLAESGVLPDVVLCELRGDDAIEGIGWLASRGVAVVVFTDELRPIPIRRAIDAGARGVVLKSDPVATIVEVVLTASRGMSAVSSDLAYRLATGESLVPRLSPREIQVLRLLLDGVPRKCVGSRLEPPVQLATVVTYINRICRRYQDLGRHVHTSADAVRAALEDGYLEPPRSAMPGSTATGPMTIWLGAATSRPSGAHPTRGFAAV